MIYAIVKDGIVDNMIVAERGVAERLGAQPGYHGCAIGEPYCPSLAYTEIELTQQAVTDLELSDIEQGQAITDLELKLLEVQANV